MSTSTHITYMGRESFSRPCKIWVLHCYSYSHMVQYSIVSTIMSSMNKSFQYSCLLHCPSGGNMNGVHFNGHTLWLINKGSVHCSKTRVTEFVRQGSTPLPPCLTDGKTQRKKLTERGLDLISFSQHLWRKILKIFFLFLVPLLLVQDPSWIVWKIGQCLLEFEQSALWHKAGGSRPMMFVIISD